MITLIASVERRSSEAEDGERDPFYKAALIMHLHRLSLSSCPQMVNGVTAE
jgi:hypothetical protein